MPGRRKFVHKRHHKTQEHAHHTHRQPQQGRSPPSASLQTREGVHVHSCCLGAAGGTRGHLFSRSIDVHGGPKQGGAGAPASDLADGDARVRAKPALRKRPHALRPGTARSPCTPLRHCEHGRSRAARSPAGAAAFSMSNSRKLLRPVSPEGHTSSAPRTGRTCGGNRLPA